MKISALLLALASSAMADQAITPRITGTELAKLQQQSPLKPSQKPAAAQANAPAAEAPSIVKQSVILHDGKNWTLVPKGSVVFIPDALRNHVDAKPVGTLLAWADFFVKNRSWITTNDVSFDQAAGNKPIPAERVAFWSKQDKIVVAVHQTGPISVRLQDQSQSAVTP